MSIRNLKYILIADAVTCTGDFAIGLLAAALLMVVAALQKAPNPALVKLIALGNLGWVAASFAVVATFAAQMTGLGIAVVVAQAFAVLGFAILEWKAVATPRVAAA